MNLELALDWDEIVLCAEYFSAWFHFRDASFSDFVARGWYVQGSGFLLPNLEAVVKVERFDPNRSVADRNDLFWTTLRLNYYLNGNRSKIMVNYLFKQEKKTPFPTMRCCYRRNIISIDPAGCFGTQGCPGLCCQNSTN